MSGESANRETLAQPVEQNQGKLHQMQAAHDPVQDRLVVRVKTTERAEFSFWFTRRLVRMMWKPLSEILAKSLPRESSDWSLQARDATLAFSHQAAIRKADFATPYEPDAMSWPLGRNPLLVNTVEVQGMGGGRYRFSLIGQDQRKFGMMLDVQGIHVLCRLLAAC